jgi:hypothetical protein
MALADGPCSWRLALGLHIEDEVDVALGEAQHIL